MPLNPFSRHLVEDAARLLLDAAMSAKWGFVVALLLVLLVAVARRYLAPKIPFFGTDAGGVLLTFVLALVCGTANMLLAGSAFSYGFLLIVLGVAWKAAGGYTALRKLAQYFSRYLPGPLAWLVNLFTANPADAAKVAAEKALITNPPTGIKGLLGTPKDVE